MDGLVFYGILILLALFAYTSYQNNSQKLAILALLAGAYMIYSNSTGHTATEYKNEMVDSLNDSAKGFAKSYGTEGFNENKGQESVK